MANFRLKQFAGEASNNGQFGSYVAGTKLISNDPNVIMNLPSWGTGWLYATEGALKVPRLEEMQGVQYVLCKSMIESGKSGINEYFAEETYDNGSLVKVVSGTDLKIYQSIANNNTGNPLTDTNFWREWSPTPQVFHNLGEIFTDGYVELLDGQGWCEGDVLPSGVYSGLVAEFDKYTADNNKGIAWIDFATYESTMLANNNNCILFGYDVVNNLIRLPSIKDNVYIAQSSTLATRDKYFPDQIQNILGSIDKVLFRTTPITQTGALEHEADAETSTFTGVAGAGVKSQKLIFDASRYARTGSETYGKHFNRRLKIQLANVGIPASESQYADFVNGLLNKSDKDGSNLTSNEAKSFNKKLGLNPQYISPEFYYNTLGAVISYDTGITGLSDIERMSLRTSVVAICKTANNGYEVGDVICSPVIGAITNYASKSDAVLMNTGNIWTQVTNSLNIYIRVKGSNTYVGISATSDSNIWAFRMIVY